MCETVRSLRRQAHVFARHPEESADPPHIPATNGCQKHGITKRLMIRRGSKRGTDIMSIQSPMSAEALLAAIASPIEIIALVVTALPLALFLIVLLLALRHAARGMQIRTRTPRVLTPFGMAAPQRSQMRLA